VIRRRIASVQPTDTWQEDGLHFFVFQLRDDDRLDYSPFDPVVAVFVMTADRRWPIAAVTVEPGQAGQVETVTDLRAVRPIWYRLAGWAAHITVPMAERWNAWRPRSRSWLPGAMPEHESGS
jgi:hypothetical protein